MKPYLARQHFVLCMKIGAMLMRGMGDQVELRNFGPLDNPNPHFGTVCFAPVLGGLCSHQPFFFRPTHRPSVDFKTTSIAHRVSAIKHPLSFSTPGRAHAF